MNFFAIKINKSFFFNSSVNLQKFYEDMLSVSNIMMKQNTFVDAVVPNIWSTFNGHNNI